jgi:hypothetical protein
MGRSIRLKAVSQKFEKGCCGAPFLFSFIPVPESRDIMRACYLF